jgi:hypothetical protein
LAKRVPPSSQGRLGRKDRAQVCKASLTARLIPPLIPPKVPLVLQVWAWSSELEKTPVGDRGDRPWSPFAFASAGPCTGRLMLPFKRRQTRRLPLERLPKDRQGFRRYDD